MEENEINISDEELKQKVWSVKEFAQSYFGSYGLYTPDMLNYNLMDININPQKPTLSGVEKALNNVKDNQEILQAYTEWAELNDMLFSRIIKYYASILAFDLRITCSNISDKTKWKSKAYKEDLDRVYSWLDKFRQKEQFTNIVKEMLRHETVFTSLRNENNVGYNLQKLPSKYCKITGTNDLGTPSFDFNMEYFMLPSVSLDMFHSTFKQYYYDVYMSDRDNDYTPPIGQNAKGKFATWVHTNPMDNFWCFKFDTNNSAGVPFLSTLLQDTVLNGITRALQADKNALSSFMAIIGEMPLLDNQKGGATVDAFAVNPLTMGAMFNLIKNTMGKSIKFGATPSGENEMYQYQDYNKSMYTDQLANMAGVGASASRTLFATDKLSQAELQACQINDYNLMKQVYPQFEKFLNFYVNKKTRVYKFEFKLEGSNFPFEREQRMSNLMTLADKGIVLKSAIQSASGYEPQEFDRMLKETKYGGFTDDLTPLISIHTASGAEAKRPTKSSVSSDSRDYDTSNEV